jgi:DNA-binding protein HU-beta
MNKVDFVNHIASLHNCTKIEAEKVIDMFTSSVIDVIGKGHEISLIGFGNFSVSEVAARTGINPKTKEPIQIAKRKQVRFKVGQKLKDACNAK